MISVIIPSINRPSLQEAIDSVKNQTTDEKIEILVEISELDSNNPVSAISKSRNKMAKKAKGEWLAFLDDDDYYLPNHLSNLNKNYDIIFSTSGKTPLLITPSEILIQLKEGFSYAGSSIIIKKELFNSVGGFNENLPHSEIWYLLMKTLPSNLERTLVRADRSWNRGLKSTIHCGQIYPNAKLIEDRIKWLSEFQ